MVGGPSTRGCWRRHGGQLRQHSRGRDCAFLGQNEWRSHRSADFEQFECGPNRQGKRMFAFFMLAYSLSLHL